MLQLQLQKAFLSMQGYNRLESSKLHTFTIGPASLP